MSAAKAAKSRPLSAAEAKTLFADLASAPGLVLAVSGGPDSTALLLLAARWRAARKQGPKLLAVTVDHGLRPQSAREAEKVKRLARKLGVPHRTLCWAEEKPTSGLQEKARWARYRLLTDAAVAAGASHVLTAHTLDDQAETVLMRLLRGSGPAGLAGMARETRLGDIHLVRPFLTIRKVRLVATLRAARVPFVDDPSNLDPRFTRVRVRKLLLLLAEEGLGPERLAVLASRIRRAEAVLEAAVDQAAVDLSRLPWKGAAPVEMDALGFAALPAEVGLRLLGRAVSHVGNEGPVELGKLDTLYAALLPAIAGARFRRTLAGAMVSATGRRLSIERAPPRRRAGTRP